MEKDNVVLELDKTKKALLKKFWGLKKSKARRSRLISSTFELTITLFKDIKKEFKPDDISKSFLSPMGTPKMQSTPKTLKESEI